MVGRFALPPLAAPTGGGLPREAADPRWLVVRDECVDHLATLSENSVDAAVTDPPYNLGFMARDWDRSGISYRPETWAALLRVLRPGAHAAVFGGGRTAHRIACACEDAGFEVRDMLGWLYASGFPKSKWLDEARTVGTALKPAIEPIYLLRKPLGEKTTGGNFAKWGTGGLNVGACRMPPLDAEDAARYAGNASGDRGHRDDRGRVLDFEMGGGSAHGDGRWPPNVIVAHLDECRRAGVAHVPANGSIGAHTAAAAAAKSDGPVYGLDDRPRGAWQPHGNGDGTETVEKYACAEGCPVAELERQRAGISRYFYVIKPSTKERDAGLEHLPLRSGGEMTDRNDGSAGLNNPRAGAGRRGNRRNTHCTVKPIALMRFLVKLITPPGGIVIDPFCGSGTTGCAAVLEGRRFIGIDNDAEAGSCALARARIAHWAR